METQYFECQCGLKDHMIVVEKDDLGVTIYVQAWVKGFWQRLVWLFKPGKRAYWHDTLIRPQDLERFKKAIGV